jgi:hypothetical protein
MVTLSPIVLSGTLRRCDVGDYERPVLASAALRSSHVFHDVFVMERAWNTLRLGVLMQSYIQLLVLQEFRLRDLRARSEAERIVAASAREAEPAVPLLTSVDDPHDVAILRGLHAGETIAADPSQRALLGRLVSSWQPEKKYGPRLAERSTTPPSYYRLAVTESGINEGALSPAAVRAARPTGGGITSSRIGLLWIGAPIGTHAGLLVLVGHYDGEPFASADIGGWPLPLSTELGVRIYASNGHVAEPKALRVLACA